jgi:uncharacterized membrane protein YwzB
MLQRRTKFLSAFIALVACVAFVTFLFPSDVLAVAQPVATSISEGLDQAASGTYSQGSLASFIGKLISALLGAVGLVFLVLTIYAGILYMTAMGAPDKVKKAKDMLTQALLGLIIIVGAYALTSFVIDELTQASSATTTCPPNNPNC